MIAKIYQITSIALAVALGLVIIFHNLIWPCDLTTEAANISNTVVVETRDTTPSTLQRTNLQPLAIVPARSIASKVVEIAPPRALSPSTSVVFKQDSVYIAGVLYVPYVPTETAYYKQTEFDSVAQVKFTIEDSLRNNRITWRGLHLQNFRSTSISTTTDVRPDRLQVYAGFRSGSIQTNPINWNYMLGIGGRIKFKRNWAIGASYLQGTDKDVRAILVDVDWLLRFPNMGKRIRENRLIRISNRKNK